MDEKAKELKALLKESWTLNKKQIIRTGIIILGAIAGLAIVTIVAANIAEKDETGEEALELMQGTETDVTPFEADTTVETTN